jgi:hypothetical protein
MRKKSKKLISFWFVTILVVTIFILTGVLAYYVVEKPGCTSECPPGQNCVPIQAAAAIQPAAAAAIQQKAPLPLSKAT